MDSTEKQTKCYEELNRGSGKGCYGKQKPADSDSLKNLNNKDSSAEISYLIFSYYGIHIGYDLDVIIYKAAEKAFQYFCRRIAFFGDESVDEKQRIVKETNRLLAKRIPGLIATAASESGGQLQFDKRHREICEELMLLYERTGGLSFGVAQRWLNQTLMNLVVIDDCVALGGVSLEKARKYFHVPVEQNVLRVASEKRRGRYRNALYLPCAPYRDENTGLVQMSWYRHGATLSFEHWGYREYMEFQTLIRERLKEIVESEQKTYRDPLDWALQAYIEAA
ncbi:MAG: hypothetical protein LUE29_04395 [Lachnospiraceae bacterium]|nr:hypothetical protein [Lachnospiraceae bacterium]